ncbi:MAG TPA: NAD-dependent epimerase/dehydratase family protein [Anaerolineaceae bacterium]|nr:NAD-dependent epimerase/dehydratase family protein [Anaerolineaceae bacterium]
MDLSTFKNKNVLITGGLGFIGSNLAIRLVEAGANVTLVDSLIPTYGGNLFNIDPIKHLAKVNISDVRDPHSMKYLVAGQDYLFNLAGQTSHLDSMTAPENDLNINVLAQLHILEACRHHNPDLRLVFASTRQIYGKPLQIPVDETHPLNPVDVNGINKLAGEQYHRLYYDVYGIRSTILRLTNTYGPRMRIKDARQTFLGIWIRRLLEGLPLQIYGDGKQVRDYNYVDDVVDALLITALSDNSYGEVYNLGSTEDLSHTETAQIMTQLHEGSFEYVPFPPARKSIDIGDYQGSFEKIKNQLGWKPRTSFRDGMGKTIAYYQEHFENYL